jgi:hypothetical protein
MDGKSVEERSISVEELRKGAVRSIVKDKAAEAVVRGLLACSVDTVAVLARAVLCEAVLAWWAAVPSSNVHSTSRALEIIGRRLKARRAGRRALDPRE